MFYAIPSVLLSPFPSASIGIYTMHLETCCNWSFRRVQQRTISIAYVIETYSVIIVYYTLRSTIISAYFNVVPTAIERSSAEIL